MKKYKLSLTEIYDYYRDQTMNPGLIKRIIEDARLELPAPVNTMSDDEFVKNAERFMGSKPTPPSEGEEIEEIDNGYQWVNDDRKELDGDLLIEKINELIQAENARRRGRV